VWDTTTSISGKKLLNLIGDRKQNVSIWGEQKTKGALSMGEKKLREKNRNRLWKKGVTNKLESTQTGTSNAR